MAAFLGSVTRIVFVKDPTVLPDDVSHQEAVEALAKANKLVILLSHGNKYAFPEGWVPPANVKLLEYDLEIPSIQAAVRRVRLILREYEIDFHSRHLDDRDALPMVLSGAFVSLPPGVELAFVNGQTEYLKSHKNLETPLPTIDQKIEWDIL